MKKVIVVRGTMLNDGGQAANAELLGNLWGTTLAPTEESARTLEKLAYTVRGRGFVGSPGLPERVDVLFFANGGEKPFEGMGEGDTIEVVGELTEGFIQTEEFLLATIDAWDVSRE